MSVLGFKCDSCKQTDDRPGTETICEECWKEKHAKLVEVADEKRELQKYVDELEQQVAELKEKLELEANVYATQIREKDVLINELLAKVHAA